VFEVMTSERARAAELRSVVDVLGSEHVAGLPDELLTEDFSELQRVSERLETQKLRWLAEIDRRKLHERDGHLSCVAWLVDVHRLSPGEAHEQVRLARALDGHTSTREALQRGEVSLASAKVLARAKEAEPEAFLTSEELLLEAARALPVRDLSRVVGSWRERVSQGALDEERYARRYLNARPTSSGMVAVDGSLDPECGEHLMTALGAVMDADARSRTEEDSRSPAQRRADALGEVCRRFLDSSDRPVVAGERPHVIVTVGLQELQGSTEAPGQGLGEAAELGATGPVGTATALRLSCDAAVSRVVLSASSEPLEVGRRTKVVPPGLRRAVALRDRGCRFPGCSRPQAWCDAHHVRHWARGGETSLSNLVLLCRRHHRSVHTGGFGLEMDRGGPVFSRPDGSVLEDRGPPGRGP
jgi:hypothetical protein